MSKYIGTPVVNVSVDTVDVTGDITTTDTTPEVIIVNNTHEDTDGGREGKLTFKGQASGGEETTLAQIQASHDGTADDEKGDLIFKTNDGSDGASPTERMRIDSVGTVNITSPSNARSFSMKNSASNSASQITFLSDDATEDSFIRNESSGTAVDTLSFGTGGSERMRIDDKGRVGIGGTPNTNWRNDIANQEVLMLGTEATLYSDSGVTTQLLNNAFINNSDTFLNISTRGASQYLQYQGAHKWYTAASASAGSNINTEMTTPKMTLDVSGNLLIGNTATGLTSAGVNAHSDGILEVRRDIGTNYSSTVAYISRGGSDGNIFTFYESTTAVGNIGTQSGDIYLGTGTCGIRFNDAVNGVLPFNNNTPAQTDNTIDLGFSSVRYDDIFATNGTINTSDQNEKQDIASLTNAEITAATAISKLFKTYKWKDKVASKGDSARTHTGVVAQQVQTAMSNAGLDASNYAFWCSDTWWEKDVEVAAVEAVDEVVDEDGNVTTEAVEAKDAYTRTDQYYTKDEAPSDATERNRKGIRYPELLAFVGAATEQRLTSIEARLTALEG